ncbi:VanZ family protein, partial [Romboutsia sp.]|uniref:VanZ family protein n=1 Tax=Romboutsia sp. TaxID=1965302 RepID=UPI003F2F0457
FFSFLFILSLTIFPVSVENQSNIRYNIIPFKTIYTFLKNKNLIESTFNILGNILLFIPLGFFSYIKSKGNIKKSFLICFYITVLAELTQLFLPMRLSDIDDIILNSMGGTVGIFVAYILVIYILKINFNKIFNKI